MKRILGIVLVITMTLAFVTGCAKDDEVEVVNPMHDCTQEELVAATGINLEAPDGADSVQYRYYDGETPIAEVTFAVDGSTYCYRAEATDATDIKTTIDGTVVDELEVADTMNDGTNIGISLAGDYYEWNQFAKTLIADRDAYFVQVKNGIAVVTWLDVTPGILYSMNMDKNASQDKLMEMANSCFVPMQGEVG